MDSSDKITLNGNGYANLFPNVIIEVKNGSETKKINSDINILCSVCQTFREQILQKYRSMGYESCVKLNIDNIDYQSLNLFLHFIRKNQIHVSKAEFESIVDCALKLEAYIVYPYLLKICYKYNFHDIATKIEKSQRELNEDKMTQYDIVQVLKEYPNIIDGSSSFVTLRKLLDVDYFHLSDDDISKINSSVGNQLFKYIKSLREELHNNDGKIEDMQRRINELEKEKQEMESKHSKLKSELLQKDETIEKLKSQIEYQKQYSQNIFQSNQNDENSSINGGNEEKFNDGSFDDKRSTLPLDNKNENDIQSDTESICNDNKQSLDFSYSDSSYDSEDYDYNVIAEEEKGNPDLCLKSEEASLIDMDAKKDCDKDSYIIDDSNNIHQKANDDDDDDDINTETFNFSHLSNGDDAQYISKIIDNPDIMSYQEPFTDNTIFHYCITSRLQNYIEVLTDDDHISTNINGFFNKNSKFEIPFQLMVKDKIIDNTYKIRIVNHIVREERIDLIQYNCNNYSIIPDLIEILFLNSENDYDDLKNIQDNFIIQLSGLGQLTDFTNHIKEVNYTAFDESRFRDILFKSIESTNKQAFQNILEYAIKNGILSDFNIKYESGKGLLHYIVENSYEDILKKLLISRNIKINFNIEDEDGKTPIFYAAEKCSEKMFDLLFQNGADINHSDKNKETPFISLIKSHAVDIINKHINDFNYNCQTKQNNYSPLMYAVNEKDIKIVQILLGVCDKKMVDINKNSALHLAVMNSNIDITKLLLDSLDIGDVNNYNSNGLTPLHIAIYKNNLDMVKLMVNHSKIDIEKKTKDGRRPIEIAQSDEIKCEIQSAIKQKEAILDEKRMNIKQVTIIPCKRSKRKYYGYPKFGN